MSPNEPLKLPDSDSFYFHLGPLQFGMKGRHAIPVGVALAVGIVVVVILSHWLKLF